MDTVNAIFDAMRSWSPEWVVAVATAVLAVFTLGLMIYTARLWGTTKKALDVTKQSVDAALEESMPLLFPVLLQQGAVVQVPREAGNQSAPSVFFTFRNFGKTPAILKQVRYELQLFRELPKARRYEHPREQRDRADVYPPGGADSGIPGKECPFHRDLTEEELRGLDLKPEDPEALRLYLVLEVIYDDVFGYRHTRGFCVKTLQGGGAGVTGNDSYNFFRRDKAPA